LSLGLGLAGLAAPGAVAQLIGVPDEEETRSTLRAVGLREIASGVGILSQPRPAGWLWSRVAGDMMDLALLTKALKSDDTSKDRVTAATLAVAGITAVDLYASQQLSRSAGEDAADRAGQETGRAVSRVRVVTIQRSPAEVYTFWRDLRNLPRFMNQLESVEIFDNSRSHWRAKGPAGVSVEWDAEIVEDRPNELISWRSLPGSQVENWGTVRFQEAPGGRGAEVRVEMQYAPPAGRMGATVARLLGKEPGQQLKEDLSRLKQVLETGEVVRSEGALYAPTFPQRPAQPPATEELAQAA